MSKKQKPCETITLTYDESIRALSTINPLKNIDGDMVVTQSELSKARGLVGTHVYSIKRNIRQAAEALNDRAEDLRKERINLSHEKNSIHKAIEEEDSKKELSAESKSRTKAIESRIAEIDKDYQSMLKEEIEVILSKGKLKIGDVQNYLSSDDLDALNKIIDFD
jgi:cell division protein ZapA (FtsZ GTPase activity inhibitor)